MEIITTSKANQTSHLKYVLPIFLEIKQNTYFLSVDNFFISCLITKLQLPTPIGLVSRGVESVLITCDLCEVNSADAETLQIHMVYVHPSTNNLTLSFSVHAA